MRRHAGNYARRAAHRAPRQAWGVVDPDDGIAHYLFGTRARVALRAARHLGVDPEEFDRPWTLDGEPYRLSRQPALDGCYPRQPTLREELAAGLLFDCHGCDHRINDDGCDCDRCDTEPDTVGPPVVDGGLLYCGAPCARENADA